MWLMENHRRILEIIACSVADAVAAERGGATRLEIIRRFDLGGLTPSLERLREISQAVRIPLRVMLRESEPFEVTEESECQRLCHLAGEISRLEVDGLVLGFLRGGQIDVDLLERVLACAKGLKITFHRAFEEVKNPLEALAVLKRYPQVDCILTSGGGSDWPESVKLLEALQQAADPEITILAGGGLDLHRVEALCSATDIRAFHLGRAARIPPVVDGEVSAARVEEFLQGIAD
jgi:copper homeostasis protein